MSPLPFIHYGCGCDWCCSPPASSFLFLYSRGKNSRRPVGCGLQHVLPVKGYPPEDLLTPPAGPDGTSAPPDSRPCVCSAPTAFPYCLHTPCTASRGARCASQALGGSWKLPAHSRAPWLCSSCVRAGEGQWGRGLGVRGGGEGEGGQRRGGRRRAARHVRQFKQLSQRRS